MSSDKNLIQGKKSVTIFYSGLNILAQDNFSGSKELLSKLNDLIIDNFSYIEFDEKFFRNLHITFQSFEAVKKYLDDLEKIAEISERENIYGYLENFKDTSKAAYGKIFNNLINKIIKPASIITLSNSETIFEVIKLMHKKSLLRKVGVSESRPQNEGRIQAERLSVLGIPVELIIDARIPQYLKDCDFALMGADKILEGGNVVNKIGSCALAICCSYFSKPLYVLADSSKFSEDLDFTQIQHSKKEVWNNPPEDLLIENYYFEEIDKTLITEIITEKTD